MMPDRSLFSPSRNWSSRDLTLLVFVGIAASVLLCTGLSIRSLWGSEGRWAVAVREMIVTGNYFLPTINGQVYFDKPLLSYWFIVPFAWLGGGVTEAIARIPSALAGIGTVLLTFCIGRKLFDSRSGFIAGALLVTTVMFTLWARTASGDLLNLTGIWCIFWAFLAGGADGKLKYLLIIYGIGAISAFFKGLVAPMAAFFVIGFYSLAKAVTVLRHEGFSGKYIAKAFLPQFRWILSWQGLFSACIGMLVFVLFVLLPVLFTGSWESVELMWRENVLRFVKPFDHVEPPYAYFKHTLVFFLPWTGLLLASLWESRRWRGDWPHRWLLLTGLAIFLFFTISGSRRSYYILPLVPALALITGEALSDWLGNSETSGAGIMRSAVLATSLFPGLAGGALLYAYFSLDIVRHIAQLFVGITAVAGCAVAFFLLMRNKNASGLFLVAILVFILELWFFSGGMAVVEKMRTSRTFYEEARTRLARIDNNKIALYPGRDSSLIFYLNRRGLKTVLSPAETAQFLREHPDGFVISERRRMEELNKIDALKTLNTVLSQKKERYGKDDTDLVILALPSK